MIKKVIERVYCEVIVCFVLVIIIMIVGGGLISLFFC